MAAKEKIKMSDIAKNAKYPNIKNLDPYDWDDYNVMERNQTYFDSEKGYVDIEMVIQRHSDSKFFKFTYSEWSQGENDILKQTAYEVIEVEKTIKTYV